MTLGCVTSFASKRETKLQDGQRIEQAKKWAANKGYVGAWTTARKTAKDGISAGTAILWKPFLQVKHRQLKAGLQDDFGLCQDPQDRGVAAGLCVWGSPLGSGSQGPAVYFLGTDQGQRVLGHNGRFQSGRRGGREWMSTAAQGAMTLNVGPTCFGGGGGGAETNDHGLRGFFKKCGVLG